MRTAFGSASDVGSGAAKLMPDIIFMASGATSLAAPEAEAVAAPPLRTPLS